MSRLFTPEAYVDPSRLFASGLFFPYNPSRLVGRKGLEIFDRMKMDEQVKMALAFKKLAAISPGWEIVSPGDRKAEAGADEWEVTTFVRDNLMNVAGGFDRALKKIMRALDYGYSITEKIYRTPQESPPWAPGKLTIDKLNECKPHYFDFDTDPFGQIRSIVQRHVAGKGEQRFPPDKFVHFANDTEHENPYGRSDLEAAYRPWFVKENAYKWFAMYLERYGIPPLVALYNPQRYQTAELEELKKFVRNIQAATMGMIPRQSEEDLELWSQNVAAGSRDIFLPALGRFDSDIAKAILQPSHLGATTETKDQGSGGSLARSNVHFRMFMFVIGDLQRETEQVVNHQIVRQLCDLNFPASQLKGYPQFTLLDVDDETEIEVFKLWNDLVSGKIVNRTTDDETYIRGSFGFPKNENPTLEDLPADMPKGVPVGAKPVPLGKQTREMQEFALRHDGIWYQAGEEVVCVG